MPAGLDAWRFLDTPAAAPLLRLAEEATPGDVRDVARLRRQADAEAATAALELAAARRKAAGKWPDDAWRIFADVPGIEMASSELAATHKAGRFRGAALDLCCGIGGDAMALARSGCEVTAVDADPVRAWMAGRNAGCEALVHDAESFELCGRLVHLDPSRRSAEGRRTVRYEDLTPGPAFVERAVGEAAGAAVKLMPGIDPGRLPAGPDGEQEVEYLSEEGRLTQAVLWTGSLAGGAPVRATLLRRGREPVSIAGEAAPEGAVPVAAAFTHMHAVDPAPERARLLWKVAAEVGVSSLFPGTGVLVADRAIESPWLTAFELLERLPWRRARVRDAVAAHGGGLVEVKTRGKACDPDAEQLALRGPGGEILTVFVLRLGEPVEAFLCRRVSP